MTMPLIWSTLSESQKQRTALALPGLLSAGLSHGDATAVAIVKVAPELCPQDSAIYAQAVKAVEDQQKGFKAEKVSPGKWIIKDVPIFAAHVDDRQAEPVSFSKDWLEKALAIAMTREAEGYLPPLHINHHGTRNKEVTGAGQFRMTRVGEISHGGKLTPALFADLIITSEEHYELIKSGKLSYRSVEILKIDSNEIDSLAFLDDEVPFFRFPLLRISEETTLRSANPLLAYSASGVSRSILFRFGAEDMKTDPITKADGVPGDGEAETKPDKSDLMLKVLMAMAAKMGVDVGTEGEEPDSEEPPAQKAAGPVETVKAEGDPEKKAGGSLSVNFAQQGVNAGLVDQIRKLTARLDAQEGTSALFKLKSSLKQKGYSASAVAQAEKIHKASGIEAAKQFAQGLEFGGPKDPPSHWGGEVQTERPDSAAVQAYASQGPEILEKARSFSASYHKTKPSMTEEEYLSATMDPAGFMAGARKAK